MLRKNLKKTLLTLFLGAALIISSACGAAAAPAAAAQPTPGTRIGEGDLLLDYTIVVPETLGYNAGFYGTTYILNDRYAGGVTSLSYYWSVPGAGIENGDFNQLKGNHTTAEGDWETVEVDFIDDGPWREHVRSIVKGRFVTDAITHTEPGDEGVEDTFRHTTFFIIFEDEVTSLNRTTGDMLTYRICYALDYVTAYVRAGDGEVTPVMDEDDILPYVRTFSLKDELPYTLSLDWAAIEDAAYAQLCAALDAGAPAEAVELKASLEGARPGDEGINFSYSQITTDGTVRLREFVFTCDGIIAVVPVDIDTCEARDIIWQRAE